MKTKLKNGKHFTRAEVSDYHDVIALKVRELTNTYSKLVITQASLLKSNRDKIIKLNPSVIFIHVYADIKTINKRIEYRIGYVTKLYAEKLIEYLEVGDNDYEINNNQNTIEELNQQIDIILST
jgi:gluconate kinase